MNSVRILDCTLRDGGYVNGWNFGKDKINTILEKLVSARIDIIECGFLTNSSIYDSDHSKYNSITEINTRLIFDSADIMYVCMINYGEYNLSDIPEKKGNLIEGIRVAFHKEDLLEALEFARGVKEKGYKLFLQPMVSNTYEDLEFIELIKLANKIEPYAFYIVDSFGVMKKNDLMRLYYLVDHNLDKTISIGFHSHNNLQLSFSNAQALTEIKTDRDIIIDASVFGMGRGAGNLNTELFVEHLNSMGKSNYNLNPLLQIIDQVLKNHIFFKLLGIFIGPLHFLKNIIAILIMHRISRRKVLCLLKILVIYYQKSH
jgi:Isopropylmalate/homocitrate/citramalate synthases